ncbi:MAG: hypothetical protein IPM54_15005 [Polyangiaceae bacterium]|nr:hypothetical protein [Polyangiaceae bacterium]
MSAAHDAHAEASAAHHDAHDHFDNEPATELAPDEPRTPSWIPYLGIALFFTAGTACLLCADSDKPEGEKAVAAAPQAQPTPPPAATPAVAPNLRPAAAMPLQPGQPTAPNALKQLSPDQAKELQKLIEQRRAQQPNLNVDAARPAPQPVAPPQPAAQPAPAKQPAAAPQPAPRPQPAPAAPPKKADDYE